MNKVLRIVIAIVAIVTVAAPAIAAEFVFHGDMNHRFSLYTNHSDLYKGAGLEKGVANIPTIGKNTNTS